MINSFWSLVLFWPPNLCAILLCVHGLSRAHRLKDTRRTGTKTNTNTKAYTENLSLSLSLENKITIKTKKEWRVLIRASIGRQIVFFSKHRVNYQQFADQPWTLRRKTVTVGTIHTRYKTGIFLAVGENQYDTMRRCDIRYLTEGGVKETERKKERTNEGRRTKKTKNRGKKKKKEHRKKKEKKNWEKK